MHQASEPKLSTDHLPVIAAAVAVASEPQPILGELTVPPVPMASPRRRALLTVATGLSLALHASSLLAFLNWREQTDFGATDIVTEAISVEIVESKVLEAMLAKQSSEPAPSAEATAPREGSVDAVAAASKKPVEKPLEEKEIAVEAPSQPVADPDAPDEKTRVVVEEAPKKPEAEALPVAGPGEKEAESAEEAMRAEREEDQETRRKAQEKRKEHEEAQRKEREKQAKVNSRAGGVTSRASEGKGAGAERVSAGTGAIMSYATKVRAQVARNKPGGRKARGTAVVSFGITVSGDLAFAAVARSSGSQALDQAALSAVRGAAPFPAPPAGAMAGQLQFSIPFQFK